MFKVSLLVIVSMLLVGCSPIIPKSVSPSDYKDHPVLYKVNYDFECSEGGPFFFKKDTLLAPVNIAGIKLNGVDTIPDSVLGLKIFIHPISGIPTYIMIYPDGTLATSWSIAYYIEDLIAGKSFMQTKFTCTNKGSVPFSQVKND
ncbi:hypothetical protein N9A28_05910 [Sulfurimonas sp.]|nr:hypothetical protein [Sulfurimonas sp.]